MAHRALLTVLLLALTACSDDPGSASDCIATIHENHASASATITNGSDKTMKLINVMMDNEGQNFNFRTRLPPHTTRRLTMNASLPSDDVALLEGQTYDTIRARFCWVHEVTYADGKDWVGPSQL